MKTTHHPANSVSTILAILSLACLAADASPVWNVNVGNSTGTGQAFEITTTDNYVGAAAENTANSTWNAVSSTSTAILADSTGSSSAGVTFKITPDAASAIDFGNQNITGDEVFATWIKDNGNNDRFTITFGNLGTSASYALVVYSDWYWGPNAVPVEQTIGTGLSGTFYMNSLKLTTGVVGSLLEDTNSANTNSGDTNYARFNGLTPDGSGNLTFSMGGVDGPINGFQLVEVTGGGPDDTKPTPDPMTWASAPAAAGSSSITHDRHHRQRCQRGGIFFP